MSVKLYLDIDGVLLDKGQKVPIGAVELIRFVVENFDCYWLTTHCRTGENKTIQYLSPFYDDETLILLERIKPTDWDVLKTDAIDFGSDFYWLEDYPFEAEMKILEKCNKSGSLIHVNLNRTGELERVIFELGRTNKFE